MKTKTWALILIISMFFALAVGAVTWEAIETVSEPGVQDVDNLPSSRYSVEDGRLLKRTGDIIEQIYQEYTFEYIYSCLGRTFAHGKSSDGDIFDVILENSEEIFREEKAEYTNLFTVTENANEVTIYNYAVNTMGLNTAAACGILANIYKESSFNPHALGDSGTSYGICQWHNSRWDRLKTYCTSNGLDSTTIEGQLRYLEYELKNYYSSVWNRLKSVDNSAEGAFDAAAYWCAVFEVPAGYGYWSNGEICYGETSIARGNLAKGTFWNEYAGGFSLSASMDESTFNSKLSTFRSNVYVHNSTYLDNESGTLGKQCFGYANYLARYIFGSFPCDDMSGVNVHSDWTITHGGAAADNLHIGDVVRYRYHSIFITGISGNTIYFTDANSDYENTVKWDKSLTREEIRTRLNENLQSGVSSIDNKQYIGWVAHCKNWGSSSMDSNIDTRYPTPFNAYTRNGKTYEVYSSVGGSKTGGWIDADDVCTVNAVYTNGWLNVTYPVSSGTRTVYMPISEFFDGAYGNVSSQTAVTDMTAYRRSDLAQSKGTVYAGDVCTVVDESGDYYCVICPWTGASAGRFLVWIGKNAFAHVHSFILEYEAVHPHKQYRLCQDCQYTEYTGETRMVADCTQCYPPIPEKPVISISKTIWSEDETVTMTWAPCKNANHYYPMAVQNGERVSVRWGGDSCEYSMELPAGEYDLLVASVNTDINEVVYGEKVSITVTPKYYTISYDANGGENAPAAQTKRHGQDITITTEIPTRAGYTFKGWAGYPQNGVELVPGQICDYNYSWTFYAVWSYIMPGKPSIHTIQSQYYSHDEVTLWWDATENTTHYNLYFDKQDGSEWVRAYTQHYAESGFSHSFESGKYRVLLQSTNSDYYMPDHSTWAYTDSDWYYFDVIDVPVTGITLDQTTALLKNGETLTLTATVTPSDAHNKAVAWSSSNTAVATVSASGVVTAVGTGVTTIIATTEDGHKTASCVITVKEKTQSVVLSPITIKNTAYEVIEAVPVGTFIAEVSLTNNTYNGICHILLATYDQDGRLLHTRYVYANPAVGQTLSFGTEFSNADETIATIKAFALSDLRSFSVLCPASER